MLEDIKENDIFLSNILNPNMGVEDLALNGLNSSNTGLMPPETYKNNPKVQKLFSDENGVFNNRLFEDTYKKAAEQYAQLSSTSLFLNLNNYLKYNEKSIYAPIGSKTKSKDFSIEKVANPYKETKGLNAIFGTGKSDYSIRELAQLSKIWDSEKGEWMDKTANELGLLGGLTIGSLVYATWDEDGTHTDPITGQLVHHRKGDYKTNDDGDFYTETIGNREGYGKEYVALSDVLTKEGTWQNKIDFFDSDGIDKSVTGIIAKHAVKMLPFLVPVVGEYFGAASAAVALAGVFPTFLKAAEGIALGDSMEDTKANKALNRWESYFKRFDSSLSDEGKKSPWTGESLAPLISDMVIQFRLMRGLSKIATSLVPDKKMKMQFNDFNQKFGKLYELLCARGIIKGTDEEKMQKFISLYNTSMLDHKEVKDLIERQSKWAKQASFGYMAMIQAADVYQDALAGGYDRRTAGLATFAALAAQYGVMMNEDALGDWFLDSSVGYSAKETKTKLIEALNPLAKEAENTINKVAKVTSKEEKAALLGGLTKKASSRLNNFFHGNMIGKGEAFFINAAREGAEEVFEEATNDAVKGMFDALTACGFGSNEDASFGIVEDFKTGSFLERYALNALGGFVGGGVFHFQQTKIDPWLSSVLFNKLTPDDKISLVKAIKEGKTQELLEAADEFAKMDTEVVSMPITFNKQGDTAAVSPTSNTVTRGQLVANALKKEIQYLSSIITDHDWKMTDDEAFSLAVRDNVLEQVLKDANIEKLVISDLDRHIERFVSLQAEYDSRNREDKEESSKESKENKTEKDKKSDKNQDNKENKDSEKEVKEHKDNSPSGDDISGKSDKWLEDLMKKEAETILAILDGKFSLKYINIGLAYLDPNIRERIGTLSFTNYLQLQYGGRSIDKIMQDYGLTEAQLKQEFEQWKKDTNAEEKFIMQAEALPEINETILPARQLYKLTGYDDVRAKTYKDIISPLTIEISLLLDPENDEAFKEHYGYDFFEDLRKKNEEAKKAGLEGIDLTYYIKGDKTRITEFVKGMAEKINGKDIFDTIAEKINIPAEVLVNVAAENMMLQLSFIPLEALSADQVFELFKNSLASAINEALKALTDKIIELLRLLGLPIQITKALRYEIIKSIFPNAKNTLSETQAKLDSVTQRISIIDNLFAQKTTSSTWNQIIQDNFDNFVLLTMNPADPEAFLVMLALDGSDEESTIIEALNKEKVALTKQESELQAAIQPLILENLEVVENGEENNTYIANAVKVGLEEFLNKDSIDIRRSFLLSYLKGEENLDAELVNEFLKLYRRSAANYIKNNKKHSSAYSLGEDGIKLLSDFILNSLDFSKPLEELIITKAMEINPNFNPNTVSNWTKPFEEVSEVAIGLSSKNIIQNSLYQAVAACKKLFGKATSPLDALSIILESVATVGLLSDLAAFSLDPTISQQLEDVKYFLNLIQASIWSQMDLSSAPDLERLVKYSWQSKRADEVFNEGKEALKFGDIDLRTGDLMLSDIEFQINKIDAIQNLTKRNEDIKQLLNNTLYSGYNKRMLAGLIKQKALLSVKGKACIPGDDELEGKTDELKLIIIADRIYDSLVSLSEVDKLKFFTNLAKGLKITAQSLSTGGLTLTELTDSDTPATIKDVYNFIVASAAEKYTTFLRNWRTLLADLNNNSVPFITQELACRTASAFIHGLNIYDLARKALITATGTEQISVNTLFIDGVSGAGKTSEVIRKAIERGKKLTVLAAAPNLSQATNLAESLLKSNSNNIITGTVRDYIKGLLKTDFGQQLYTDIDSTDGNLKIIKSVNTQFGGIRTIKDSNIATLFLNLEESISNAPDIIIIDEATHLSGPEMEIIEAFREACKKQGKIIAIIYSGDSNQMGATIYTAEEELNTFADTIKWTTPALSVSVRSSAQGKRLNNTLMVSHLRFFKELQSKYSLDNDLHSEFEKYIANASIALNYYENDIDSENADFQGDKLLSINTSNQQLAIEYGRILRANRKANKESGKTSKIMIIANIGEDRNPNSELDSILRLAGFKKDEYELYSPLNHHKYAMLGSEARYVIVHDTKPFDKTLNSVNQLREIYTLLSRSLDGTVARIDDLKLNPHLSFNNIKLSIKRAEPTPGASRAALMRADRISLIDLILQNIEPEESKDDVGSSSPTSSSPATPTTPPSTSGRHRKPAKIGNNVASPSDIDPFASASPENKENTPDIKDLDLDIDPTVSLGVSPEEIKEATIAIKAGSKSVGEYSAVSISTRYPEFAIVYSGMKLPRVRYQINPNTRRKEYVATNTTPDAKGNRDYVTNIGLNAIGNPGKVIHQRVETGLNLFTSLLKRFTSKEDLYEILTDSTDTELLKNICMYFWLIDPSIFYTNEGPIKILENSLEAIEALIRFFDENKIFDNPELVYVLHKYRKRLDSLETKKGNKTKLKDGDDYIESLGFRIRAYNEAGDCYVDRIIELGSLSDASKSFDRSLIIKQLTNRGIEKPELVAAEIINQRKVLALQQTDRRNKAIGLNKEVVLFKSGIKLGGITESGENIFDLSDSITKYESTDTLFTSDGTKAYGRDERLEEIIRDGYRLDKDMLYMEDTANGFKYFDGSLEKHGHEYRSIIALARQEALQRNIALEDPNHAGCISAEFKKLIDKYHEAFVTRDGRLRVKNCVGAFLNPVANRAEKNVDDLTTLTLLHPVKLNLRSAIRAIQKASLGTASNLITLEEKSSKIARIVKYADGYTLARIITTTIKNTYLNNNSKKYVDDNGNLIIGNEGPEVLEVFNCLLAATHNKNSDTQCSDYFTIAGIIEGLKKGTITNINLIESWLCGKPIDSNGNSLEISEVSCLFGQAIISFCKDMLTRYGDSREPIALKGTKDNPIDCDKSIDAFTNPNTKEPWGVAVAKIPVVKLDRGNKETMVIIGERENLYYPYQNGTYGTTPVGLQFRKVRRIDPTSSTFGLGNTLETHGTILQEPSIRCKIDAIVNAFTTISKKGDPLITGEDAMRVPDAYIPSTEYLDAINTEKASWLAKPDDYSALEASSHGFERTIIKVDSNYSNAFEDFGVRRIESSKTVTINSPRSCHLILEDGKWKSTRRRGGNVGKLEPPKSPITDLGYYGRAYQTFDSKGVAHDKTITYSDGYGNTITKPIVNFEHFVKPGDIIRCYGEDQEYRVLKYVYKDSQNAYMLAPLDDPTEEKKLTAEEVAEKIKRGDYNRIVYTTDEAITDKTFSFVDKENDAYSDSTFLLLKKRIWNFKVLRYEKDRVPIFKLEEKKFIDPLDWEPAKDNPMSEDDIEYALKWLDDNLELLETLGREKTLSEEDKNHSLSYFFAGIYGIRDNTYNISAIDHQNEDLDVEKASYILIPYTGGNLSSSPLRKPEEGGTVFHYDDAFLCSGQESFTDTYKNLKDKYKNEKTAGVIVVRLRAIPHGLSKYKYISKDGKSVYTLNDSEVPIIRTLFGNKGSVSLSEVGENKGIEDLVKELFDDDWGLRFNRDIGTTFEKEYQADWFKKAVENVVKAEAKKYNIFATKAHRGGSPVCQAISFFLAEDIKAYHKDELSDSDIENYHNQNIKGLPVLKVDSLEKIPFTVRKNKFWYRIVKEGKDYNIYITKSFYEHHTLEDKPMIDKYPEYNDSDYEEYIGKYVVSYNPKSLSSDHPEITGYKKVKRIETLDNNRKVFIFDDGSKSLLSSTSGKEYILWADQVINDQMFNMLTEEELNEELHPNKETEIFDNDEVIAEPKGEKDATEISKVEEKTVIEENNNETLEELFNRLTADNAPNDRGQADAIAYLCGDFNYKFTEGVGLTSDDIKTISDHVISYEESDSGDITIICKEGFVEKIRAIAKKTGLDPKNINCESRNC